MSNVTNVILACSILDKHNIKEVNMHIAALYDVEPIALGLRGFGFTSADAGYSRDCDRCVGGSKALETPLAIAAFNYLDESGLRDVLRKIQWVKPESVQLIIKRQSSDIFEIVFPCRRSG